MHVVRTQQRTDQTTQNNKQRQRGSLRSASCAIDLTTQVVELLLQHLDLNALHLCRRLLSLEILTHDGDLTPKSWPCALSVGGANSNYHAPACSQALIAALQVMVLRCMVLDAVSAKRDPAHPPCIASSKVLTAALLVLLDCTLLAITLAKAQVLAAIRRTSRTP